MQRLFSLGEFWRKWNWDAGSLVLKTALAAGTAWALALNVVHDSHPVFAPLAALLVVQVTIYQTVSLALKRSIGVVAGVILASALGRWLGIHAWSIALLCAAGLALGRSLRLGTQSVQVAVSALLVLSVSGNDKAYAISRILETILGGAVGVMFNVALLPPVHVRSAEQSLRTAAHQVGKILQRTGFALGQGPLAAEAALELLRAAREQPRLVAEAGDALTAAEESLRLNLRHGAARINDVRRLRKGLESVERVGSSTRSLARALHDFASSGLSWDEKTRAPLAGCVMFAGFAITRYGDLVEGQPEAKARIKEAIGSGRQQLAMATQLLREDGNLDARRWELDGSMLADLRRIFDEIEAAAK